MDKNTKGILIGLGAALVIILFVVMFSSPRTRVENTDVSVTTGQNANPGNTPVETVSAGTVTENNSIVSVKIGESILVSGVTGTITEVLEDSRCPSSVQCIQAGTVRVKVNFAYGAMRQDITLKLGEPYTAYGRSVTLLSVKPEKISPGTIDASLYVFSFEIK